MGRVGVILTYDERGVSALDDIIERVRTRISEEQTENLILGIGLFLGECIRRKYGGEWVEYEGQGVVMIAEGDYIFPFSKVGKQFDNGDEDSILGFYHLLDYP